MKLSTKSSGKDFNYVLCPEGTHAAVCVAVVDLGTQTPTGKFADQGAKRKVYIVWELTEEATRPLIGKDFTASLNEKATLRKWIENWRGKKFGDEDFEVSDLAGKKCLLTITHTGSGEKTYHNAASVSAPMKGQKIRDPQVEPFTFDLEDGEPFRGPTWDLPYWYGRSIEEVISECHELKGALDRELMGNDEDRDDDAGAGDDGEAPF